MKGGKLHLPAASQSQMWRARPKSGRGILGEHGEEEIREMSARRKMHEGDAMRWGW